MVLKGGDNTPASTLPAFIEVKIFDVVPVPMSATSRSGVRPFLTSTYRASVSVEEPIAVMPMILFFSSGIDLISGFATNQNEGLMVRKQITLTGSPRAAPHTTRLDRQPARRSSHHLRLRARKIDIPGRQRGHLNRRCDEHHLQIDAFGL